MTTPPIARQLRSHASVSASHRAAWLARLSTQALIAEAELTPKPGLVDRRGRGAHEDLSLSIMRASALAIEPYLAEMALASIATSPNQDLRERLAAIGRRAERAMYLATGGCNSHKGAIWVMGLLVAAASIAPAFTPAAQLGAICAALASFEDRAAPRLVSHGHVVACRYGFAGARGEAREGFPHVVEIGLPALRAHRQASENESMARLNTLLTIMSTLADTCVLYRGQTEALEVVRASAREILEVGGCSTSAGWQKLQTFDESLLRLHVSPGGSADLLAATLFLDALERGQETVQQDASQWEESYGAH